MQVNFHKRSNVAAAEKVARCTRKILGSELLLDTCPVRHHVQNIEVLAAVNGDAPVHAAAIAIALEDSIPSQRQ